MLFLNDGTTVLVLAALTLFLSKVSLGSFFNVGAGPVRLYLSARLLSLASHLLKSEPLGLGTSTLTCLLIWAASSAVVTLLQQSSGLPSRLDTGDGPWLLPCRTTHTRQFPKTHSFSYSYLQVAFRVGPSSIHGRLIKIEKEDSEQCLSPWTWFSISSTSYLTRDQRPLSLRKKLDQYLRSEGVNPKELPNAFLVTAPRFLGYSFNPVSFWYLYDERMRLQYMILEVNNTFDERRPYLLKHASDEDGGTQDGSDKVSTFRQQWAKDFHVSPFNSRKGSYLLVAVNPSWSKQSPPKISNTITLRSSKDHAKLVARLFSTEAGKRVDEMGLSDRTRFVLAWFWVGLVTFPRILKEAAKLFFRRGLHVWYRPEVLGKSMGRNSTAREEILEWAFVDFLDDRSDALDMPVQLFRSWESAGAPLTFAEDACETDVGAGDASKWRVRIYVNSPEFFVRYARDPELIFKASEVDVQARVFSIEGDEQDVRKLFSSDNMKRTSRRVAFWNSSLISRILQLLASRFAPSALRHPLHYHVWRSTTGLASPAGKAYRKTIHSLLLGDLIFMGIPEALDALLWITKTALALGSIGQVETLVASSAWSTLAVMPTLWVAGFLTTFLRPQPAPLAQTLRSG